jgi:biotin synthase-like enzyme
MEKMQLISHRFDPETLNCLKALALARHITPSAALRLAVREAAARECQAEPQQTPRLTITASAPASEVVHE